MEDKKKGERRTTKSINAGCLESQGLCWRITCLENDIESNEDSDIYDTKKQVVLYGTWLVPALGQLSYPTWPNFKGGYICLCVCV